jgi:hypothetical protein
MQRMIENLRIGPYAMRYSQFVPRLYNYCRSLGFARERMMPSRAFCSDESQGYPVILLTQHFGTFPFDHGRVGGKVAVNRHGPYANHGEDLVIIQASHVGYDAESGRFGVYKRHRTDGGTMGKNLLFISGVNVDISPREAFPFPLIKFVPWAAYAHLRDGRSFFARTARTSPHFSQY